MELLFRERQADEVEQEVTQRDQFNTDEVSLAATLMREAHQNSLDAPADDAPAVRTRVALVEPDAKNREAFTKLLEPLVNHLVASGIDPSELDLGMPRCLVIEDFGTTGLLGDWSDVDDTGPFNDFWRRIGKSHKSGASGGRWGLGKLVFSSASKIRSFFGLTIRSEDPANPLLMGQAVLATHKLNGRRYAPHGFFAERRSTDNLQLPTTNSAVIAELGSALGFIRKYEPGLSISIPFVLDEITIDRMIPEVLRNYFFPILTGQLEVQMGSQLVAASTFDTLAAKYATGQQFADGELIAFIRSLQVQRGKEPDHILSKTWTSAVEHAIPAENLERLRHKYMVERGLIHVRAPLVLRHKKNGDANTYFDLFLQRAKDGSRGDAIYVRSAITVPDEARYFRAPQSLGALIATDDPIAAFLGDAENPAHTRWNGSAEKLDTNWRSGKTRLSEIRNSLMGLYRALARAVETEEPDALIDILSIKDKRGSGAPKPHVVSPPVIPSITPRPKLYRIVARKGGFSIRNTSEVAAAALPFTLSAKVAYDVLRGNAFKKFDSLDFDLGGGELKVETAGATTVIVSANELRIEIQQAQFSVDVSGFDVNRDLLVKVTR